MPRPRRIQAAGLTYHVTGRGVRRSSIYLDEVDRRRFVKLLAGVVQRYALLCHAYCEMTNHYHLAITTLEPNVSSAMRYLNGRYAQWWNWRHRRTGHLFDKRFDAQIVQESTHLANVCRYIALNPVRAGIVVSPEEWSWSSYRATIGSMRPPRFLDCTRLLAAMGDESPATGARRFHEWVLGTDAASAQLSRCRILGDEAFVAYIKTLCPVASCEAPNDEKQRTLASIFDGMNTRSLRNQAVAVAAAEQFTLTDIARFLKLDVSTVSKIVSSRPVRQ
jgi:REP element-mobilizing transposase RayT